jgi:hypothetical protein
MILVFIYFLLFKNHDLVLTLKYMFKRLICFAMKDSTNFIHNDDIWGK